MTKEPKVAVVTGASAGVGRATAVTFAERGYDLVLVARGEAGLDGAVHDVEALGRRAVAVPGDIADPETSRRAAAAAEDELGEIAVWVNDAMTTVFAPFSEIEPDDFRRAVEVTFLGQVWGTKAALEVMKPRDRGQIVNIGSALAFIGIPLQSPYCASKFACRGFFESVRAELIHEGSAVRISMVHLPAVNTPQFTWCETTLDRRPQPVPPIYQPETAAAFIVDVAEDGRRSRIVGSWNRLLVTAAQLAPSFGNQFAALSAWDGQLTGQQVREDRPSNLWKPVDEDHDVGSHGEFGDRAGGFLDPSFLTTLPETAATFAESAVNTVKDAIGWRRAHESRTSESRAGRSAS